MKILLLNPHVDAQHAIAQALRARGHALLFPVDVEEAWQMIQLHESNLDLAIIHREGIKSKEDGIRLISKLKGLPQYYDLPIILTSEIWNDPDFVAHQQGPQGVNAYLHWPFQAEQVEKLIIDIFGTPPPAQVGAPTPSAFVGTIPSAVPDLSALSQLSSASPDSGQSTTLEPPSSATVFAGTANAPADSPADAGSFRLEEAAGFFQTGLSGAENAQNANDAEAIKLESPLAGAESPGTGAHAGGDPMEGSSEVALPTAMNPMPNFAANPESSVNPLELSAAAARGPLSESFGEPSVMSPKPTRAPVERSSPLSSEPSTTINDEELAREMAGEMPYLFSPRSERRSMSPSTYFEQPIGDAVVPGGAAQSPDAETLKKYLLLREQDVAALSAQLRTARQEIDNVKDLLREEHARNAELSHLASDQKRRLEEFEKVKAGEFDTFRDEIADLRFQARTKTDKARVLESQVREAAQEIERLKERVRSDLRKIRIREKELENRLEIVKKDSEALLLTRENKIIELKRKVDLLEFNMDLLQDQFTREKETSTKLRERLGKAAQVVRVAGGLLDPAQGKAGEAAGSSGSAQGSQGGSNKKPGGDPAREAS